MRSPVDLQATGGDRLMESWRDRWSASARKGRQRPPVGGRKNRSPSSVEEGVGMMLRGN